MTERPAGQLPGEGAAAGAGQCGAGEPHPGAEPAAGAPRAGRGPTAHVAAGLFYLQLMQDLTSSHHHEIGSTEHPPSPLDQWQLISKSFPLCLGNREERLRITILLCNLDSPYLTRARAKELILVNCGAGEDS